MERFSALIGFFAILLIAYLLSTARKSIRWKTVGWGLFLQIVTAILVLKGELIASKLAPIALPFSRSWAALAFIVLAVVV
jgi:nucleoside permease NupC